MSASLPPNHNDDPPDYGVICSTESQEEDSGTFNDLLAATQGSLDFWDNPLDDEDWNKV